MTIKQQLLQEIESTSDTILAETLIFLHFLKTKETPTQSQPETSKSATHTPINSTGHSLLEHLKTIGKWEGDDLKAILSAARDFQCIQQVKTLTVESWMSSL